MNYTKKEGHERGYILVDNMWMTPAQHAKWVVEQGLLVTEYSIQGFLKKRKWWELWK